MAVSDSCLTAPSSCNNWLYQSLPEQRFLLMQLLNALLDTPETLDNLQNVDSAGYICQGSATQLRMLQAQMVAAGLDNVVTAQPVCWTPLQIEGAIAYLYCELLAQLNAPV